jgi:HlyD family secretion protein
MRFTKARIITGVVGAAAVVALTFAMRSKPLVVDAVAVSHGPLESTVDADGRTRVRERYVIVAPVAGRVERLNRVEGSMVRPGDVVARLTPLPLDSTALLQAQARVDAADAVALQASAQTRVASAQLAQRVRELSRAERLADVGGVAPRVVEECQLARTEAEEALRAAQERSRAADAEARQARAVLVGQAGAAPAPLFVRAPAAGRVLRIAERSERVVAAGTPLMEIGDPASLEVVVDVLSSDGAVIHPGDRVRLTEWMSSDGAEPRNRSNGRVRDIEPAGFTKVSALGVEEQRVNVIVDLDTVPRAVGDGFRVEVSVIVWSAPDVVIVPRSALLQGRTDRAAGADWNVFVVSSGRAEQRVVRIGHGAGANAEVLDGLRPGESVVVFPSDQLKGGDRVVTRKS